MSFYSSDPSVTGYTFASMARPSYRRVRRIDTDSDMDDSFLSRADTSDISIGTANLATYIRLYEHARGCNAIDSAIDACETNKSAKKCFTPDCSTMKCWLNHSLICLYGSSLCLTCNLVQSMEWVSYYMGENIKSKKRVSSPQTDKRSDIGVNVRSVDYISSSPRVVTYEDIVDEQMICPPAAYNYLPAPKSQERKRKPYKCSVCFQTKGLNHHCTKPSPKAKKAKIEQSSCASEEV